MDSFFFVAQMILHGIHLCTWFPICAAHSCDTVVKCHFVSQRLHLAIENVVDCIHIIYLKFYLVYTCIMVYIYIFKLFNYVYIYIYSQRPNVWCFQPTFTPLTTQFFRQRDQPHHEFLGFILMFTMNNDHGRMIDSGQFITTSAEVTPNGGLVRESPPKWP